MNSKKFLPCIYLYQKRAVRGLDDWHEVSIDPVALAESYSDNKCDGIIVFDLSSTDREHEEAIDIIKEICATVAVPVIGAGAIHRMEDVKKLLYAGCRQAVLDYTEEDNIAVTREVSLKFGADKLLAMTDSSKVIREQCALINQYISSVLVREPAILKETAEISPVPVITTLPEISLVKIIEILKMENVDGIAGKLVNDNYKEIEALKKLCRDNGIEVSEITAAYQWSDFKLNSDGMIPVIVQDYKTDAVLMQAYMNEEAYLATIHTGKMTYYSRSRQELWIKGETSGHYQYVKSLHADCDMDTILARVVQIGAACHTGSYSCFFNEILTLDDTADTQHNPLKVFEDVFAVIKDRKENPKEGSYTNYLFDKGIDKILKKLGEEATEIVIAAKNPNPNEIKYEICDFLYHMMVLMAEKDVTWEEITAELANR
ncbi:MULTISPECIES: bifunctional phosphoribosyl-AMP cyclohydrolase/phosphoribosyl-ATP diphosphatase HisIE [Eisenbergiella]|uniref:Histidine biosynthesis bifunctional protein HisIE n=1 Tax=Eisenbergiella porci TaxID=2652274 RepID=A0A6N7VX48_9FIRM|nr:MULTISPECIES: bifunctional phosphoribosyl-AMP cyclohydrolase/phosphoribosyl-ATP diphosphatase HisIE [Eisenbergiella]MDY2653228.1 bifunctional phosphoribosyl-AMP cyclohydrolase/phosphoribosyl-ATP diphosphatase HisIE [Eisenbergiella porci]MSS87616.1 bifunctional phosphoribosyl-AMP cyclohydrolase/phosphoribosyl-ATP diphosphatase HisIE [Eisenbergiella porci]